MSMFSAHIAIMLEVFGLAGSLIALHYANVQRAKLMKWAGVVLLIASISGFSCTIYYSLKYYSQGAFETAYGARENKL